MIVAIDGPAGAGKSTIARAVARRHDMQLVDTGAMYRSVAYQAGRRDVDLEDPGAVAEVARSLEFEFRFVEGDNVTFCNGEALDEEIRTGEVSRSASIISAYREVREVLIELQREVGRERPSVLEGRDIGTVVFPNAEVKVFLTATSEERARRRLEQMEDQGREADFDEVLAEIKERDRRDTERDISPLEKAEDAVEIDTDQMSVDEVVQEVEELISTAGE